MVKWLILNLFSLTTSNSFILSIAVKNYLKWKLAGKPLKIDERSLYLL